jgi:prophage regulatory protein
LPASHKSKNRACYGAHVLCEWKGFAMTANGPRKMLLEEAVLSIVPISRTTLWRLERAGKFPRGTFISSNKKIWYEDQIVDWQTNVDERQPPRRRGKKRDAVVSSVEKSI